MEMMTNQRAKSITQAQIDAREARELRLLAKYEEEMKARPRIKFSVEELEQLKHDLWR